MINPLDLSEKRNRVIRKAQNAILHVMTRLRQINVPLSVQRSVSMDALLLNLGKTVVYVESQRKKHKEIMETRCIRKAKEPKIAFIVIKSNWYFNKS
ncbi:hypothetical protein ACN42_g6121 [Penicillium freii]|uniref:Uncharacterized protein n=1 Tax=Penicillium freii TaxID=48697 RepID=A0A101MIB8_PENFR|nr:hypothetical protein ACN42_g6121 [Penicillium freii]